MTMYTEGVFLFDLSDDVVLCFIKLSLTLSLVGGFEALLGLIILEHQQEISLGIPNIWISFNHNLRYVPRLLLKSVLSCNV